MTAEGIPPEVEQLVRRAIGSVQQLEVLLFLREHTDRAWTAAELSAKLRTGVDATDGWIAQLEANGLVAAEGTTPTTFRYGPAAADRATVEELARLYPLYRVRIVNLIHADRTDSATAFADAFRLRRRKGS